MYTLIYIIDHKYLYTDFSNICIYNIESKCVSACVCVYSVDGCAHAHT